MIIFFLRLFSRLFSFFCLLRRLASFGFSTSSCLIYIFCAFFFFPIYASPHHASLTSS